MAQMIGLARAVRLDWLDEAAKLAIQKLSREQIADQLNTYLACSIQSPTNIRKTREILLHTWVDGEADTDPVYACALRAYQKGNCRHLLLHWCLLLYRYPVFAALCGFIGKISSMQDTFRTSWLKERLYETWGERTTLMHAVDKILQLLVFLGVVTREKVGVYRTQRFSVTETEELELIMETLLHLKGKGYYSINELSQAPEMFPFQYEITHEWLYQQKKFPLGNFGGQIVVIAE